MSVDSVFRFNKIWFSYFFIKLSFMFFSILVYSQFTTLGDTERYINGGDGFLSSNFWYNSTSLMDTVAHTFSLFLGPLFANFPFLVLSYVGIYYSVSRLAINNSQLFFLLALLSFPSFGIWTSIASKEAVGVFYLGVILGYTIDTIKRKSNKNNILFLFSLYLCAIFKPQYLVSIISLLIFVFFSRKFALRGLGKSILLVLFFFLSFVVLYVFRHQINDLSFVMPLHFDSDAGSARENTIWVNDFDVFRNAPYGMFIGFFGPTASEALSKFTHLLAFLESFLIVGIFVYYFLKIILFSVSVGRLNVFYLGIFITVFLWMLFVHYPFGVLNPGSAIRYRESFYAFLVVLFYFYYLEVKRDWLANCSKVSY